MTRKDYKLIAESINDELNNWAQPSVGWVAIQGVIDNLCTALMVDNSAFNRDKFVKACGIEITR